MVALDCTTGVQVVPVPRTVLTKRNHRVVTDKEDIQERNWVNKGKVSSSVTQCQVQQVEPPCRATNC